jgi:hypothetical protein
MPFPATHAAILGLALAAAVPQRHAQGHPSPVPTSPPAPEALLSRRALRRARLLVQIRMLQFRNERLECIRLAILSWLPPDLRPEPLPPATACPRAGPRAP